MRGGEEAAQLCDGTGRITGSGTVTGSRRERERTQRRLTLPGTLRSRCARLALLGVFAARLQRYGFAVLVDVPLRIGGLRNEVDAAMRTQVSHDLGPSYCNEAIELAVVTCT